MKITKEILVKVSGISRPNAAVIDGLVKYLPDALLNYDISSPLRVGHFLAQASHESDHFKTLREYWGPTAAQRRYEGRADLGNVRVGDGKRYMGRGIFQLTGRANYRTYGRRLGIDLEGDPELAANPEISVLTACEYWKHRRLSEIADQGDTVQIVRAVTRKINGGYNGIDDRIAAFRRAMRYANEIVNG